MCWKSGSRGGQKPQRMSRSLAWVVQRHRGILIRLFSTQTPSQRYQSGLEREGENYSPYFFPNSCNSGAIFLVGMSRRFPMIGSGFGPGGRGIVERRERIRIRRATQDSKPRSTGRIRSAGWTYTMVACCCVIGWRAFIYLSACRRQIRSRARHEVERHTTAKSHIRIVPPQRCNRILLCI